MIGVGKTFSVTLALVDAVQLFALVTVTMYEPCVTVLAAVLILLLHA